MLISVFSLKDVAIYLLVVEICLQSTMYVLIIRLQLHCLRYLFSHQVYIDFLVVVAKCNFNVARSCTYVEGCRRCNYVHEARVKDRNMVVLPSK
jgi:hypothetical protein